MRIFFTLICALVLIAQTPVVAQTEPFGTIEIQMGACDQPLQTVDFSIRGFQIDGPGSFVFRKRGPLKSFENRVYRFSVPPGAYHYGIDVRSISGVPGFSNDYVTVMPGQSRRIEDLPPCALIADPLTPMLVAGLKPLNVTVSLSSRAVDENCNRKIDAGSLQWSPAENDRGAYYAAAGGPTNQQNVVPYLVRIQRDSGDFRLLRIDLRPPEKSISGDPTFLRLDITQALLGKLFADGTTMEKANLATVMCL